jgi:hypothetical protein
MSIEIPSMFNRAITASLRGGSSGWVLPPEDAYARRAQVHTGHPSTARLRVSDREDARAGTETILAGGRITSLRIPDRA